MFKDSVELADTYLQARRPEHCLEQSGNGSQVKGSSWNRDKGTCGPSGWETRGGQGARRAENREVI